MFFQTRSRTELLNHSALYKMLTLSSEAFCRLFVVKWAALTKVTAATMGHVLISVLSSDKNTHLVRARFRSTAVSLS